MVEKLELFRSFLLSNSFIWGIGSLILFVYLIFAKYYDIYDFHLQMCRNTEKNGKEAVILTDPKQIRRDKRLCFLSAFFCLAVYSTICVKLILYLLALILQYISAFAQMIIPLIIIIIVSLIIGKILGGA